MKKLTMQYFDETRKIIKICDVSEIVCQSTLE